MAEIGNEVLDDPHVRQRIDSRRRIRFLDESCTGQPVRAVHVHGARTADALPAGAPEGQRRIDVVLDPDERVEDPGAVRSEEPRGGKECGRTWRSGWSP